eukprot:9485395-Karenia_brevis.AAC.1
MLASFLEVMSPRGLTEKDSISGVHQWQRRAADLRTRYGEEIKGNLKLVVFFSMLPKAVSYTHLRAHETLSDH